MRVLVSAYACEPHMGSEGGVGWNWVKQIARFAEVWVITRANNREIIEGELKKNPVRNLHFTYYDVPSWLSFWKKKTRGLYFYYLLWQIGIYSVVKKLHRQKKFDIVHHLTFGNFWLPTFMFFINVPFIWGPIGGGDKVPLQFRKNYTLRAKLQEMFRDFILGLLNINPLFLHTCNKATKIIVRTQATFKRIPKTNVPKMIKIIETGIYPACNPIVQKYKPNGDIVQILSAGRLIHLKGFDLALSAFAKAFRSQNNIRMTIIGDGNERKKLQKICKHEKITNMVLFMGQQNHDKVLEHMSSSHIFLFPSLKEGAAWVLFEAMSSNLPIICLDIGGSGEIVNDECGITIKPQTPEQTINDIACALLKLANDHELRKRMGEAGRKRVLEHYNWNKKGELIKQVYAGIK